MLGVLKAGKFYVPLDALAAHGEDGGDSRRNPAGLMIADSARMEQAAALCAESLSGVPLLNLDA